MGNTCSNTDERKRDPYSLDFIRIELAMRAQGVIQGHGLKYLARLGDAAAIALVKIVQPNDLLHARKLKAALSMIRDAFAHPEFIERQIDRTPDVSILWLEALAVRIPDAGLNSEIAELCQSLRSLTSR